MNCAWIDESYYEIWKSTIKIFLHVPWSVFEGVLLLETIISFHKLLRSIKGAFASISFGCNIWPHNFADKKSKGYLCEVFLLLSLQLYMYVLWIWSLEGRHQKVSFSCPFQCFLIMPNQHPISNIPAHPHKCTKTPPNETKGKRKRRDKRDKWGANRPKG